MVPAPAFKVWCCTQISPQRAGELETAVAAAAEASPTDSLVLTPRTASAVRNPATLASQVRHPTCPSPAGAPDVPPAVTCCHMHLRLPAHNVGKLCKFRVMARVR